MTSNSGILAPSWKHYVQIAALVAYPVYAAATNQRDALSWILCGLALLWGAYLFARLSGRLMLWKVYEDQDDIQKTIRQDSLEADDLASHFDRDKYVQLLLGRIHSLQADNQKLKDKLREL